MRVSTHHFDEPIASPSGSLSRRATVAGASALALGGAAAACAPRERSEEQPGAGALATKSQIPVGGGKVLKPQNVVVTQPSSGEFKAFTAVCTHQGCVVARVAGGEIQCDCHGSRFSIVDGRVTNGPATRTLPSEKITIRGDDIVLG